MHQQHHVLLLVEEGHVLGNSGLFRVFAWRINGKFCTDLFFLKVKTLVFRSMSNSFVAGSLDFDVGEVKLRRGFYAVDVVRSLHDRIYLSVAQKGGFLNFGAIC